MLDREVHLNLDQMEKVDAYLSLPNDTTKFIVVCYLDSTECQTCATNKLYLWNNFMKKYGHKYQIDFIFIFSPSKNSYRYLQTFLKSKKEKKNIYIDTLNTFEQSDPFIPSSAIFHTMLVDKADNKIKLVGDPRRNPQIEKLFLGIVNHNDE